MTSVHDPRTAATVPAARTTESWTEPTAFARGRRPSSQYWDVTTARWVTRSPVPLPRRGD